MSFVWQKIQDQSKSWVRRIKMKSLAYQGDQKQPLRDAKTPIFIISRETISELDLDYCYTSFMSNAYRKRRGDY